MCAKQGEMYGCGAKTHTATHKIKRITSNVHMAVDIKAGGENHLKGCFFSLLCLILFSWFNSFLHPLHTLSSCLSARLWQCEYSLQRVQPGLSVSLWRPLNGTETKVVLLFLLPLTVTRNTFHTYANTHNSHLSTRTYLTSQLQRNALMLSAVYPGRCTAALHCR